MTSPETTSQANYLAELEAQRRVLHVEQAVLRGREAEVIGTMIDELLRKIDTGETVCLGGWADQYLDRESGATRNFVDHTDSYVEARVPFGPYRVINWRGSGRGMVIFIESEQPDAPDHIGGYYLKFTDISPTFVDPSNSLDAQDR